MQRSNTESIGSVIARILRESGLDKPLLEKKIVEAWPEVLGPMVARYTGDIYIRDGMLYVHIKSAPLRQELFNCRFKLVEKLQNAVGAEGIIRDIRLLN